MTGMIGLINQCGRQMVVVIVCDKYPRGVGLCRSSWGGRPEKMFSNLGFSISREPAKPSRLKGTHT